MKTFALVAPFVFLAISAVRGTPLVGNVRRGTSDTALTQTQALQFALTLEHLENAYYTEALAKFSKADFLKAGYKDWQYGRLTQIADHEATHVKFLTTTLGADAVDADEYNFQYTTPGDVFKTSLMLERVGTAAYLGAAHFLTDPNVITAAGAILTTEARQASWTNSAVFMREGWPGPYETPLTPNQVYTIASQFITNSPQTNPELPVKANPVLNVAGTPKPGGTVTLSYDDSGTDQRYLALLMGLDVTYVPIENKKAIIPTDAQGVDYAIVTSDKSVSDESTIAGPALLMFPFASSEPNPK